MAKRISELDAASALTTGDELLVLQAGAAKRGEFSTAPDAGKAMAWPSSPFGSPTVSLTFGGANTGITYSNQFCRYQKIGSWLNFIIYIALSNKGTATGAAVITGLPVPSSSADGNQTPVTLRVNGVTHLGFIQAFIGQGGTTISLASIPTTGTSSNLTDANFSNTSTLMISGAYYIG